MLAGEIVAENMTVTGGTIGGCRIVDRKLNIDGITAKNVDISGKITATEGTIGGCTISSDGKLQVAEANISGELTAKVLNINNIKAKNVDITGKITATEGIIGGTNGWKIGTGSISSSNSTCSFTLSSTGTSPWLLVQRGNQTKVIITPDGSMSVQGMEADDLSVSNVNITSGQIKIGSNFNVSNTGVVTANGGKFDSGTFTNINASSGTIGSWTIDGGLTGTSTGDSVTIAPSGLTAHINQNAEVVSSSWFNVARAGNFVSQGQTCSVVAKVRGLDGKDRDAVLIFSGGILVRVT
jgi:hypothetical protein